MRPSACVYLLKTSSAAGSGAAGAAIGFGAAGGPDTTVTGALLGDMAESIIDTVRSARAGKTSAAVGSAGDFFPGDTRGGAPFAAARWQVKQGTSRLPPNPGALSAKVRTIMHRPTRLSLLSFMAQF